MSLRIRIALVAVLAAAGLTVVTPAQAATLQSGIVTTGDGTPLEGATVGVFDATGKSVAKTTTTAADGSYTLEDCAECLGATFAAAEGYYSSRSGPNYKLFATTNPYVGWSTSTILTFGWDSVPGAAGYRVTLADEPTFKHPKIITKTTSTVHTFKQLRTTHLYYVHVFPVDGDSHVIRPDIWLGDNKRATVGRTGYVNNLHLTARTTTSLTFEWAPYLFAKCCTDYDVQISSMPNFQYSRIVQSLNGNDTLTITNLTSGKTYYTRVRARNPSHTVTTGWSGARQHAPL